MSAYEYRLHYFNGRGAGETPRLIMSYAKVPFEDIRYAYETDWPKHKERMPWGKLPVLDVLDNGERLAQSKAIICFLARRYGLDGASEIEKAKCEEYLGVLQDLQQLFFKTYDETEVTKKLNAITKAEEETFRYLSKFDMILEKQGNGYLVGSKLTYADIFLAEMVSWICEFFEGGADCEVEKFPLVLNHKEMVANLPGIKEWIEKRPTGDF